MIDPSTLSRIIDVQGLAAVEPHVSRIVAIARRHGINPVATDVLGDTTQPEVARLRALARVQRDLAQPTHRRAAAA